MQMVVCSVAWAEVPHRRAKRVSVFPARRTDLPCAALFGGSRAAPPPVKKVEAMFEAALGKVPDVEVVGAAKLRSAVSGGSAYKEKLVLGRERFLLAKEFYRDLRQEEAEENLERSVELLESVYYDAVEPDALAEIFLLLGVTLMEEGKAARAHQAFKRSLMLAPSARFSQGYYPEAVEQAIGIACEDLAVSMEREVPLGTVERSQAFLQIHSLDALFFPVYGKADGKDDLTIVVFERGARTASFRERIVVGEGDPEHMDRAVSRWAACSPFQDVPKKLEEKNPLVLSTAYQHMVYPVNPTRNPLQTFGFSFEVGRYFRPSFGLVAKAQLMSSISDQYGDLLESFTSARLIVGPALSVSGSWWRLYVVPGAEFHYMGSFEVSSDPDCKFFAPGSSGAVLCDPAPRSFPEEFVAGVNVSVGSQFFVAKEMFLSFAASLSTYIAPFDRSFNLNFPIGVEAGGGVAF